ncbi:MAG: hypothetical protein AAF763_03430 [Pseudomonadota bacterium]
MTARPALPLLAALLLAAPALAQPSPSGPVLAEEGEDIPEAEWRAMTAGRTVWYLIEDEVWGRESYRAGSDALVFQFPDGQCLPATWSYEAPWFCFDFGDALPQPLHCFRHLRWQGGVWVLGDMGAVQQVDRIDDAPVACGPNVSS